MYDFEFGWKLTKYLQLIRIKCLGNPLLKTVLPLDVTVPVSKLQ